MPTKPLHLASALHQEAVDKRIDILRRIGEVGSISEAGRAAGVSYKAAWQAVETLSNLAGTPLVEKAVGGAGGGGARLTTAGIKLLRAADVLSAGRTALIAKLQAESEQHLDSRTFAALGLRTSMRNQLPCEVIRVRKSGTMVRVELAFGSGARLISRITNESVELLGLTPKLPVLALCKATAVRIAKTIDPIDGYNVLNGVVTRTASNASGGEVSLRLMPGMQLVGFAEADHGLKAGEAAMASVEESGVVIAVSA